MHRLARRARNSLFGPCRLAIADQFPAQRRKTANAGIVARVRVSRCGRSNPVDAHLHRGPAGREAREDRAAADRLASAPEPCRPARAQDPALRDALGCFRHCQTA